MNRNTRQTTIQVYSGVGGQAWGGRTEYIHQVSNGRHREITVQ